MTYCMLSLDLKDADTVQRADFNERLGRESWVKLPGVDTVWQKEFGSLIKEPSIRLSIAVDLEDAAGVSRIKVITSAVQIGDSKAITGKTIKVVGDYVTTFE